MANGNNTVEENNVDPNITQQDQGQQSPQVSPEAFSATAPETQISPEAFQSEAPQISPEAFTQEAPATRPTPAAGDPITAQEQFQPGAVAPTPPPTEAPAPEEEVVQPLDEKELTQQIVTGLQAAGKAGQKIDEAALARVLQQQLDRFGDQANRADLLRTTGRVTQSLFDQFGGREALFDRLNKTFVKNRNIQNMPNDQIAQSLVDGSMTDDDLDDIRIQDPAKYNEIIEERNEINNNDALNQRVNGKTNLQDTPKASANQYQTENALSEDDIDAFIGGKGSYVATYNDMVNTEEVKAASKEANDLKRDIEGLDEELFNLKDTLTDDFETSLSKSALSALVREESEDINKDKRTKVLDYNAKVSALNELKKQGETQFGLLLQERKEKEDRQWRQLQFNYQKEQDTNNFALRMKQYDMSVDQQQWQRDFAFTQRTWDMEDRQWVADRDIEEKITMSLEGQNGFQLASQVRKLEAETGQRLSYGMRGDGSIAIFRSADGTVIDNYVPLSPQQKEVKENLVNYAISNEGVPYVWGGTKGAALEATQRGLGKLGLQIKLPKGLGVDCSGLLVSYGRQAGLLSDNERPTASTMFAESNVKGLTTLQDGDMVYYKDTKSGKITHVAIARGPMVDGKLDIIDASTNTGKVSKRSINLNDKNMLGKFQIIGADNFLVNRAQAIEDLKPEEFDLAEIAAFNNSTFKPQKLKTKEEKKRFSQFLSVKNKALNDPKSAVGELMWITQGGKRLAPGESEKMTQTQGALGDVDELLNTILEQDKTGKIVGSFRNANPYDVDALVIQNAVNAAVPNLARGVFGEVGVLTDSDVARYRNILPSLTNTADQNRAATLLLTKSLMRTFENDIRQLAGNGKDVSGFQGTLKKVQQQVNEMESLLGIEPEFSFEEMVMGGGPSGSGSEPAASFLDQGGY